MPVTAGFCVASLPVTAGFLVACMSVTAGSFFACMPVTAGSHLGSMPVTAGIPSSHVCHLETAAYTYPYLSHYMTVMMIPTM
eukprot:6901346-Karenia_brevis.AAC.1